MCLIEITPQSNDVWELFNGNKVLIVSKDGNNQILQYDLIKDEFIIGNLEKLSHKLPISRKEWFNMCAKKKIRLGS